MDAYWLIKINGTNCIKQEHHPGTPSLELTVVYFNAGSSSVITYGGDRSNEVSAVEFVPCSSACTAQLATLKMISPYRDNANESLEMQFHVPNEGDGASTNKLGSTSQPTWDLEIKVEPKRSTPCTPPSLPTCP